MRLPFLLLLLTRSLVFGQGTFLNLNFEGTTLPSNQLAGFVPTIDAFPEWTVRYGDTIQAQVAYNGVAPGPAAYLWTRGFSPGLPSSFGNYSPVFTANDGSGPLVSFSQIGTIPISSTSLVFETWGSFDSLSLQLTFNGNALLLESTWMPGLSYATWRADISAFAGQEGELSIIRSIQPEVGGFFRFDNLAFIAIPEPSTWALLALGSAAFFATRRRRK